MKQKLYYLCFVIMLATTIYSVQGVPYDYFTEYEQTPLGETVRFFSGDTIWGAVRSNDSINIMQRPVYYDYVVTSALIVHGIGANPAYMNYEPIEYAPRLEHTHVSTWVRGAAQDQGFYFDNGTTAKALVHFDDHSLRYFWGEQGVPYDTTVFTDVTLPDSAFVFFECPVEVSGIVSSVVIFGALDIGLEDNIMYAGTDPVTGEVAEDETAKLVLVSDGDIKILNTPANGRDNQAEGSDIIINALLVALDSDSGNFTFDQQNDVWDTYQGPTPDERGRIFLTGGIYQHYRGYVHRSNHGGTGYLKHYNFDDRFRHLNLRIFQSPEATYWPDTFDVGVTQQHNDLINPTAVIALETAALVDIPEQQVGPFTIEQRSYVFNDTVSFIIRLDASAIGTFDEELSIWIEGNRYPFRVHGEVTSIEDAVDEVDLQPSTFTLSAFPNPFNPATTIRFTLLKNEAVTLSVYNTAGQLVETLLDDVYNAGEHHVRFDGAALPSGLYFARLQTGKDASLITKLLLVK